MAHFPMRGWGRGLMSNSRARLSVGGMKTKLTLLLVMLGLQILAAGCTNTAKGISKDYGKAEDKVESIGK